MGIPSSLYRPQLALLTDLYQLTMAAGYHQAGVWEREAVFHLFFRKAPFAGGYTIAAGLAYALDYLEHLAFDESDLEYLAGLTGADGAPLFPASFLDRLRGFRFDCDVDAVPEGTAVFPQEPLLRVRGPIASAQLVETALLNIINFQSLVATKAARVCLAARGEPVIEFGLRRAQGIDGGLAASRAAYVGGCESTSNVLAGKLFGIPVKGTHAHSWVMLFGDELEAFRAYAAALPNNCVFLVDTYDTIEGVRHAVEVGKWLRERGQRLLGVRLDSGDLAYLSQEARRILDEGGFSEAKILASNDLDEHVIESLKKQDAKITVWGVGTRIATAYDQPALGGVYKLAATREPGGAWDYRIKVSEQSAKVTTPGILGVRRYRGPDGFFAGDAIYDELLGPGGGDVTIVDPADPIRRKALPAGWPSEELLVPVMRGGRRVYDDPPLAETRARTRRELEGFHAAIKRHLNPHSYPVGLESRLHALRTEMALKARDSRRPQSSAE